MQTEYRNKMRGGLGTVQICGLVPREHLSARSRLFALETIEKGCSIGRHMHENETEFYYVLEGEGVLDDNGVQTVLRTGDCSACASGEYHAIANEKDQPLLFLAVIIMD